MSDNATILEPDLEDLKRGISPENIAYFSEWGSTGPQAREVCVIIKTVRDTQVLQALLEHSKTLRAPYGKEFPIKRVQSAIVGRLEELRV